MSVRVCSFCGKTELEVRQLVAGGGMQPRGQLPKVYICDECVALCANIIGASIPDTASSEPPWQTIEHRGEQFEWLVIPAMFEGIKRDVFSLRRPGSKKTVGYMVPADRTANEESVSLALAEVAHLL